MNTRKTISTWAQRFTLSFGEGWGEVVSFIGGGIGNTVNGSCAVIAGGRNNTATGADSAILGGNGNNDGGLANVHIAGSGIALGVGVGNPNSLHVNGLWANGIPPAAAGPFNAGTVFWLPAGAPLPFLPLPTTGQLWIM